MRAHITITAVFAVGFFTGLLTATQERESPALPAERVTGIGGVFFKARDPKALSAWYREKLGLAFRGDGDWSLFEWREREDPGRMGSTVWSLFRSDSKYFAPSQATFMINYRVRDLDRMLAQLRALGVSVDSKVVEDFNGKFAWVVDPEGTKIELWEPKAGY
jgi:catechol 2,3-dioxygenase-like lactoylglutathione lyase family enzyme